MNNQNHLSNFQRLTIISPLWTRLQGWVRLRRESCESCESRGWERTQIKVEGFNLLQTGWIWSTSINRTNISMVVNENIFLIISPLPFYHARTVSALSKSWARAVSPRERRGGITTLQDGWNCVLISSALMELNNKCGNTTYKFRCIATGLSLRQESLLLLLPQWCSSIVKMWSKSTRDNLFYIITII